MAAAAASAGRTEEAGAAAAMEVEEEDTEEEWRPARESQAAAAGAAAQGSSSHHQSIPLFAQALSLLTSFPTPPPEGLLLSNAAGQTEEGSTSMAMASPLGAAAAAAAAGSASEEDKSRKKMRSKNWTRVEMVRLIRLRTAAEPRFAGGGKKVELWDDIADALKREGIARDGQQCRDKWEKLCAAYKEVRDGSKLKEDFPLFDDLHPILSGRAGGGSVKRPRGDDGAHGGGSGGDEHGCDEDEMLLQASDGADVVDGGGGSTAAQQQPSRKRARGFQVTDIALVHSLVDSLLSRQQRFFKELLESMERRQQAREQIRQEREERWRREDRAQCLAFSNAMISLAQKLVDPHQRPQAQVQPQQHQQHVGPKKRSKNWKRAEVIQLIRLRCQMESQFAGGTKRSAVWEELAQGLMQQGIPRDGKQCREKWDKLMAAFKDVTDGVKQAADMPYFNELSAALRPTTGGSRSRAAAGHGCGDDVPLEQLIGDASECGPRSPQMT